MNAEAKHFKKHLFDSHNDIEVYTKYGRRLQEVVGYAEMQRLRTPILRKALQGKLDEYIVGKIDPMKVKDWSRIWYREHISDDPILENQTQREDLYLYRRELLLRLAHDISGEAPEIIEAYAHEDRVNPNNKMRWDLTRELYNEYVPIQVIQYLEIT